MTEYEFTFLLNEEEELKKTKELIQTLAGKILKEESWGKKTLAFPVKKQTAAHFYVWRFEIDTSQVKELRRKLNFNEKLLRYLLLKIN